VEPPLGTPGDGDESETIGTFYVHWEPPVLYEIETDEEFSLDELMQELGRLELQAPGRVKHGDVPSCWCSPFDYTSGGSSTHGNIR
jgi:hypothetical protein